MQNVTPFPNPSYVARSFSSISLSSAWCDQKSLHLKAPTIALVGALTGGDLGWYAGDEVCKHVRSQRGKLLHSGCSMRQRLESEEEVLA